MILRNLLSAVFLISLSITGCIKSNPQVLSSSNTELSSPPKSADSVSNNPNKILIDASRDGGVWWFPQGDGAQFKAADYHQGKPLVDWLIGQGYQVDELPRGTTLTTTLLRNYTKIIRTGSFGLDYSDNEMQAYEDFINRKGSLLLMQEFINTSYNGSQNDKLSEYLGITFEGTVIAPDSSFNGLITVFNEHAITAGVSALPFIAGSGVTNTKDNKDITILGSFDNGYFLDRNFDRLYDGNDIKAPPVMGILNSFPNCRIFFIGDVNGLESLPQPFTQNLMDWLFKD